MAKIARRKIASYIAAQLEAGVEPKKLAQHAVAYLVEQKQTKQLELLIRDIEVELASAYGTVAVRVSSAHQLDDATRAVVTDFIKDIEKVASVVITDETIDSALIGGVVIETPTSTLDSTIRKQLRQLTATTRI